MCFSFPTQVISKDLTNVKSAQGSTILTTSQTGVQSLIPNQSVLLPVMIEFFFFAGLQQIHRNFNDFFLILECVIEFNSIFWSANLSACCFSPNGFIGDAILCWLVLLIRLINTRMDYCYPKSSCNVSLFLEFQF